MHVDDSTVLFGFPASDLKGDCARTVQISLAFELLCTIVRAQTIENKEMHFAIELLRGALLARKAGALVLLRTPKPPYIPYPLRHTRDEQRNCRARTTAGVLSNSPAGAGLRANSNI
jgi:hypothetical protein